LFHRLFDDPWQFIVPGLIVGMALLLTLSSRVRNGDTRTPRVVATIVLVLWFGFVVFAALIGPTNLAPDLPRPSFNLVPWGSFLGHEIVGREREEVIGNLVLFMPLGALLPFIVPRLTAWWRVALIAFVISFALETTQYVANVGRSADVDDAILNALGAIVGWLGWRSLARYPTHG
jgi:glycopeptide antibiotics resistance protein